LNIAVCVKQAIDEAELKVDDSGKLQLSGAPTKMSTFDKNAVEEAVRLKTSQGGSVTVVTLGSADSKRTMKEALAMGADRGVLVVGDAELHDTLTTSYYLARALKEAGPLDLVICSEGSSDIYTGQVGPMIAEWSALPFIGYARKIEVSNGRLECEQLLEDRVDTVESAMPAVVSVVSEINEPRYPTLIQIMQAAKKPIEEVRPEQLKRGDAPLGTVKTLGIKVQSMNRKNVVFEGPPAETAKKLYDALASEGLLRR
jgi:electron transfer flavoprotein beta subunit